jgi:hypothetical protein
LNQKLTPHEKVKKTFRTLLHTAQRCPHPAIAACAMAAPAKMSKEEAIATLGLMPEEYDEVVNDFDEMDADK